MDVDVDSFGGKIVGLPGEISVNIKCFSREVSRSHSTYGNKLVMLNPSTGSLTKGEGLNIKRRSESNFILASNNCSSIAESNG